MLQNFAHIFDSVCWSTFMVGAQIAAFL